MWKDFFYFSRGQRTGIIILIGLILCTVALNALLPLFYSKKAPDGTDFLNEAHDFQRAMVSRDSLRQIARAEKYKKEYNQKYFHQKSSNTYSLFKFDPNKADSVTLTNLGIKNYIASNILKFRRKGGVFKTKESFAKVYGLTPEKFSELEPYIEITPTLADRKDTLRSIVKTENAHVIVELNSADTTELMKVVGIGRFYAKAIVRFRQQTGGFVNIDQLHELYGMTDQNFNKISPYCHINTALVQKIKVNTASTERLNVHPYLNFYESKAIYEYRRRKGKLQGIQELRNINELSSETVGKIEPYLSFE